MEDKPFRFITFDEEDFESGGSSSAGPEWDCFVQEELLPGLGPVPSLPRAKLLRECGSLARKKPEAPGALEETLASGPKLQALQSASTNHTMRSLRSAVRPGSPVRPLVGGFRQLSASRATGLSAKDFGGGSFKRLAEAPQLAGSQCTIALKLAQHRGDPAIDDPALPDSGDAPDRRSAAAGPRHLALSVNGVPDAGCRDHSFAQLDTALKDHRVSQNSFKGGQMAAQVSKCSEAPNARSRHSPPTQPRKTAGSLVD